MKKVALALITDKSGRVFLQHRDGNAPTNPNKWGLWGGQMEEGENPDDAIARELKEELDIDVAAEDLKQIVVIRKVRHGADWEGYVFNVEDRGYFNFILQEGDGMEYFTVEETKLLEADPILFEVLTEWEKIR